jgi:hypothetical protein
MVRKFQRGGERTYRDYVSKGIVDMFEIFTVTKRGAHSARRLITLCATLFLFSTASSAQVLVTVDGAGPIDVGLFASMQLNGGNPVISYYDNTNDDLKLATCTANCATASPTWQIVTVDSSGDVGQYTSLQLSGGNPVIAYHDATNFDVKLATCTANCASATPTWQIVTVDSVGSVGRYISMQLNGGNPVISYYDFTNFDLKLATCTANCASASPTWQIVTVDSAGNVGEYTSLQLNGANPVISYQDAVNDDLKLATCTANCASATPTWQVVTVDSNGVVGQFTSLQLNAGNPVISYYDNTNLDLKLATCTANCASATPTWQIVTVDSAGSVGTHNSLQLLGGNPVISYYDRGLQDLKLAACASNCASATPSWEIVTVDSNGNFGEGATSLQLNGGNPVIAYYERNNDLLKLATFGPQPDLIVTPSATSANGTFTPPDPQTVQPGETQSFIVTPNAGYVNGFVGGTCPLGSFSGSIYTTAPINANCTVVFNFVLSRVDAPSLSVLALVVALLGAASRRGFGPLRR